MRNSVEGLFQVNKHCPRQRRAAKIVYGFKPDIATETILENLRWPPLTKTSVELDREKKIDFGFASSKI